MPQEYDASKQWRGKKVVLVSVPGAFTPGCQANHLPPYIQNLEKLKGKGVNIVAVIAFNDSWVMSAWGKVNKVSGEDLVSVSRLCIDAVRVVMAISLRTRRAVEHGSQWTQSKTLIACTITALHVRHQNILQQALWLVRPGRAQWSLGHGN